MTPTNKPKTQVIAVWRYVHIRGVEDSVQNTRRRLLVQATWISNMQNELRNLRAIFIECDKDYWETHARWTREWLRSNIADIRRAYNNAAAGGQNPLNTQRVFNELLLLEQDIQQYVITLPDIVP
jgi:hypothetical protein